MRFVHTADIHFGGSKYLPDNLERQEEAFDQIFDVAADQGIDVVVIAGDLFDESDPDSDTRDLVQRKLLEYDSAGFSILVIPGNHDLVDSRGYTALHYLALLYRHGRFKNSVVTEETCYIQIKDTVFCLLVHSRGEFSDACQKAVQDFHQSSIQHGATNFVVVAHETIRGSQTDVRLKEGVYYRLEHGEELPDAKLDVTYWALGDIHKAQSVGTNAFYSGAPLQIKFGDDWPKGVLIVDTDDPDNPKFADIETNRLVKASPGDHIPPNSYVKLKVKNKSDLLDTPRGSNVVRIEVDSTHTTLELDVNSSIKEKLIEGVKQQGATGEVLSMALTEIESLLLNHSDV